jgi:hypothetical protein
MPHLPYTIIHCVQVMHVEGGVWVGLSEGMLCQLHPGVITHHHLRVTQQPTTIPTCKLGAGSSGGSAAEQARHASQQEQLVLKLVPICQCLSPIFCSGPAVAATGCLQ